MIKELSEWLSTLDDDEFVAVRLSVKTEQQRRKPHRRRGPGRKTKEILAALRIETPATVARSFGVSRQYIYELCKRHDIAPVRIIRFR